MKLWPLLLILLTGCAAKKKPAQVQYDLPIKCIIGATLTSECKQISESAAVCNGVVVKFACVKVKEKK